MTTVTIIFAVLGAVLVWSSFGSVRGGIRFHRFFKSSLVKAASGFTPFATAIVPCRGVESGLRENLEALFHQTYPAFEVVFATDSEQDPSVSVIREFLTRPNTKLVVAGAADGESQKVRNLRAAIDAASDSSEVFVFMDSDARPSHEWLRSLVSELTDPSVGVSTGYRWFVSPKKGLASELRACWNASVASRLGEDSSRNFCWGGSMAILRERFEGLSISERWKGALSDDYAVMRAVRGEGLGIAFVPSAMCASVDDCTFREMLEFTTRQMKITRVYAPRLWLSGLVGAALFNLVIVSGVMLILFGSEFAGIMAVSTLSLVWGFSVGKAYIRLRAVEIAMPDFKRELRAQTLWQVTLWTVSPAVFLYNCLAALASRDIEWRGIRYRLLSPEVTEIVRRN